MDAATFMYSQPARVPRTSPFNQYSVEFPPPISGTPRLDEEEMAVPDSGGKTNDPKRKSSGHQCHMCAKELQPDFVSRSIQKGSIPKKCWACGSAVRHCYAHGYRVLKMPASETVPEKATFEAPAPETSTSEAALVPDSPKSEAPMPETSTSEAALVPETSTPEAALEPETST